MDHLQELIKYLVFNFFKLQIQNNQMIEEIETLHSHYEDIVNKMDRDRQLIIKDKNTFGKQIKVKQNMIDELELKLKSAYLERDHYKELMDEGELKFENLTKQMSIVKQSDTLKTLKNSNLSNFFDPFQNLSYFLTFLCKVYI